MSFALDFSFLSQSAQVSGSDKDQQDLQSAAKEESAEAPQSSGNGDNPRALFHTPDPPPREQTADPNGAIFPTDQIGWKDDYVNQSTQMSLTSDDGQQNPGLFQHRPAGTNFERAFAHIQVPTSRAGLPPSQPSVGVNAKVKTHNPRAVLVSRRQAGNPLLKFIRNVPWEHADILADYQMGSQTCALFLSVRFHLLKPKYIYSRMEQLQTGFKLRVLICHIDTEDSQKTLTDIHKAAILNNWTLILSWSPEESARYLETYQTYEHKQADSIQERVEGDYMSRLTDVLTNVRSVNRTDVANLSTSLGSLANIMTASRERLALCPGVGEKKIQRLFEAFREPFRQVKKPKTGGS